MPKKNGWLGKKRREKDNGSRGGADDAEGGQTNNGLNPMASTGVLGSGFGGAAVGLTFFFPSKKLSDFTNWIRTCLDYSSFVIYYGVRMS